MKRFITALGICALLFAPAQAFATVFTWGGQTDDDWKTNANFDGGLGYPGKTSSNDDAVIDSTTNNPVRLASALPSSNTIVNLDMRNGTSGTPMSIRIDNGVTLGVTGTYTVGDPSAASYVEQKTGTGTISAAAMSIDASVADEQTLFRLRAGTLDPGDLSLYGGSTSSKQAVFYSDGGTLTTPDSTIIQDHVELFVADGDSPNFGDTRCNADATLEVIDNSTGVCQTNEFRVEHASDTVIAVTKTGAGELDASSFVIKGSANQAATLTVSAGSIVTT